ncbi:Putative chaperonin [hydrothermal vent metagenome]|uniref:Putative chaperonin n=1 Tax=hydrothermal vent metagenome TaxID=652676 RepID=A0A1W1C3K9_9ZZZZ
MKYKNLSNQKIYIDDKEITSGGQGAIHKVTNSNSVAKIYKDLDNLKKAKLNEKIRFMIANPPFDSSTPQEIIDSIIWPTDVLYDRRGFVGFVMPFVKDSIELSNLVFMKKKHIANPIIQKFKKDNNSDFFRQRLIMCYNLASVLKVIHQRNQYVVVDLKPQNVLIDITGKIVLIDIDSIQVKTFNDTYYADAWTDDYAPPEFHNRKINPKAEISPSWDYFAFASTAYQLLFQIPAFMGSVDGQTTLVEKIAKYYFPHGKNRRKFRVIPKPHEEFRQLSSDVKRAFIDSFDNEPMYRADFGVWVDCLASQIGGMSAPKKNIFTPKVKKTSSPPPKQNPTVQRQRVLNRIAFKQLFLRFFSKIKVILSLLLFVIVFFAIISYLVEYIQKVNQVDVYGNIFDLEKHYSTTEDKLGKLLDTQTINGIVWEQHIIKSKNGSTFGWIKKD